MSTAIISGVFALIGAFGGVWITQRYALRLERERRTEERRDAHHQVISELLASGWAKVNAFLPLIPEVMRRQDPHLNDLDGLTSDAAREIRRINAHLQRTLVQAALLTEDQRLLDHLATLRRLDASFDGDVVGQAMEGDPDEAFTNFQAYRTALNEVEATAVELLRVATKPPRSLQRRWRAPESG
jgi:hypothetical protein